MAFYTLFFLKTDGGKRIAFCVGEMKKILFVLSLPRPMIWTLLIIVWVRGLMLIYSGRNGWEPMAFRKADNSSRDANGNYV